MLRGWFLLGLIAAAALAPAARASSCVPTWQVVSSPATTAGSGWLESIGWGLATDAWAVGSTGRAPLVERWNGRRWALVASPRVASAELDAVAVAGSDVWAVGGSANQLLALRWDGRAWKAFVRPSVGGASVDGLSVSNRAAGPSGPRRRIPGIPADVGGLYGLAGPRAG